ncbi:MAG: DJ-1/PfpI family protein [Duganella sp.]
MPCIFRSIFAVAAIGLALSGCASGPAAIDARSADHALPQVRIAPYQARFGRSQPVVAVVGDNRSTELTDYVVPYGILRQAGVAQVVAVSTDAGPIRTTTSTGLPSFQIQAEATIAQFDARFPDGADYVVVPASRGDGELPRWIAAQVARGATIVSICNGAQIVAKSQAMNGHLATAHWSTEADRMSSQPAVRWVRNSRYVADRNWVSSAGVSASIPVSIALVEALAGRQRADGLASELALNDWSARHDSDAFQPRLGKNLQALASTLYTNAWFYKTERLGLPVAADVNEVALALTTDAYSSTGRSQLFVVADSKAPLRTRHGLLLIPDRTSGQASDVDRLLPPMDDTPSAAVLDQALAGIARSYGRGTAFGVALLLEYPDFRP